MFIHVKPNTAQSSYIVILYTKRIKIASLAHSLQYMYSRYTMVRLALIESDGFDVDCDKRYYIWHILWFIVTRTHGIFYIAWICCCCYCCWSSTRCGKYNKHIWNRFDTISKLLIFTVWLVAIVAIVFRLFVCLAEWTDDCFDFKFHTAFRFWFWLRNESQFNILGTFGLNNMPKQNFDTWNKLANELEIPHMAYYICFHWNFSYSSFSVCFLGAFVFRNWTGRLS